MPVGDITDALVNSLKIRLEDEDDVDFGDTKLLGFLNEAQTELIGLIDNAYLTEIEVVETSKAMTALELAFSSLTYSVCRGGTGITKVKIYPGGSNGKFAVPTNVDELKRFENSLVGYSDSRPMYYVYGEKIIGLCTTSTSTKCDVWYLREPVVMTTDVDPDLNAILHPILLDLAENRGWLINHQGDRAVSAMNSAVEKIKIFNSRVGGK